MATGSWRVGVIGPLFDESGSAERARLAESAAALGVAKGATEDDIIASCAEADVVMCLGLCPFTERVFRSLPKLTFLQQCTVGYDRVDLEAATRLGVMVANSPWFCTEEVSDHAAMLVLACGRALPQQLAARVQHGWNRAAAVAEMGSVFRLRGRTLGFVGFGRIARRTAEKLGGFDMHYVAYDPFLTAEDVRRWRVDLMALDDLCRRADIVSIHTPLSASTHRLFGESQFRAMKPTAYFVNTARGGTVDETALIRALREGWIAGAGLDVLEQEPPDASNPLLTLPNVLMTPHTAGYGVEAMADNRRHAVDEVLRVFDGEWPRALLNPEVKSRARIRARPAGSDG